MDKAPASAPTGMTKPGLVKPGLVPSGSSKQKHIEAVLWKTTPCTFFESGCCKKGKNCTFAHGEEDTRLRPDLIKTVICSSYHRHRTCRAGDSCRFAHGPKDLRKPAGLAELKAKGRGANARARDARTQADHVPTITITRPQGEQQLAAAQRLSSQKPPADLPTGQHTRLLSVSNEQLFAHNAARMEKSTVQAPMGLPLSLIGAWSAPVGPLCQTTTTQFSGSDNGTRAPSVTDEDAHWTECSSPAASCIQAASRPRTFDELPTLDELSMPPQPVIVTPPQPVIVGLRLPASSPPSSPNGQHPISSAATPQVEHGFSPFERKAAEPMDDPLEVCLLQKLFCLGIEDTRRLYGSMSNRALQAMLESAAPDCYED